MDTLTTAVPTANRAQRRAIQREQKKAAKKAAKKAIKLGLPVPVSNTEISVQPASAASTNTTITPTTILKEVVKDDKNAVYPQQGSPSSSKRSSLILDLVDWRPVPVILSPASSALSTKHDDTILDSVSVITDLPHIIKTVSTHEEVIDREETLETEDGGTETLAPLLCPVYVTQASLPEHRQNDYENEKDDDTSTSTKEVEEEIISDTTSTTVKPSSFLSSPTYSLNDLKHLRTEQHYNHAISPDHGHHHLSNKNSDHINFLENQHSAETLVLKTKTNKKFHKVLLTSLKKKKAIKKEKEPKAHEKPPPMTSTKKSWQFWKKSNDKIAMT